MRLQDVERILVIGREIASSKDEEANECLRAQAKELRSWYIHLFPSIDTPAKHFLYDGFAIKLSPGRGPYPPPRKQMVGGKEITVQDKPLVVDVNIEVIHFEEHAFPQ